MKTACIIILLFFANIPVGRSEHPSVSGAALEPAEIAANMFELEGQVVKIKFNPGPAKQTSREYYEVQVPGDTVVLIPAEIGRKWFAPKSSRNLPDKLFVKVEIGELQNQYGKTESSAILKAIGVRSRRGMSNDDVSYEW